MAPPSPKRRKVSPVTGEPGAAGSAHVAGHPLDPDAKQQRPSFASPTKASMERYNPDILRSRGSSPKRRRVVENPPPASRRESLPTQRKLFPPSQSATAPTENARAAGAKGKGKAVNVGESADPAVQLMSGATLSSPEAAAAVAASELGDDASPFEDEAAAGSTPSKKTPYMQASRPNPRPLPPPGPEEDVLEPLTRNRNRIQSGLFSERVAPEPELPPTPEHPDPVVSTPPSGIHNTPSRRFKRQRSVLDKSSPLKKQLREEQDAPIQADAIPISLPTTTAVIRGLKRQLPKSDQENHLEALRARNRELKAQLARFAQYNQQAQESAASDEDKAIPKPLLDLLYDAIPGTKAREPQPSWASAAFDASCFLPFGKPNSSMPNIFARREEEPEKPIVSHRPLPFTADTRGFMRSFSNLTLSSRTETLPKATRTADLYQKQYINAESSNPPGIFAFSVAVTVNTRSQKVEGIEVPQIHPAAVAETSKLIQTLTNPRQDSSRASRHNICIMGTAMSEWLRVAVARAGTWHTLKQELATKTGLEGLVERMKERHAPNEEDSDEDIEGGMEEDEDGRWPLAAEMDAEWPEDEGIDMESPGAVKDYAAKGKNVPSAGDMVVVDEPEEESHEGASQDNISENDGSLPAKTKPSFRTHHLLPYLGQTSMDFSIPRLDQDDEASDQTSLHVQWKIGFRSTGYAVSDIKLLVGAPPKWHATDKRGKLLEIPTMFDKLIEAGEAPVNAVRIVAALLAGEPLAD